MLSLNQRALLILSIITHPNTLISNKHAPSQFEYSTLPNRILQFNQLGLVVLLPWLSAILAIISTQSILMLSDQKPLNLFFLLFILLVMPWLTYLLMLWLKFQIVKILPSTQITPTGLLSGYIKHMASEAAFVFSLVSWVCIWLNLLLTDIPLGWSSTFSLSSGQLAAVANSIAFLWSGWLESFSLDVSWFEKSQYFHLEQPQLHDASQSAQGWRFIMLGVLVYSLLPRLMIYVFHKIKLNTQLKKWIQLQWPLMIQQMNQSTGNSPKSKELVELTQKVFEIHQYDQVLGWQTKLDGEHWVELGTHAWQHDLDLINKIKLDNQIKTVAIVVNSAHAPVAELSDLLSSLKESNPAKTITLVVLTSKKVRDGQIYSWQSFAKELNIQSYMADKL
ncbi:DUF2868 domain-containing protein [Marinicellulosiphila megalodicopiae]|uniref:DUF2868 domain-containing protein n=1 Tax=Marinicellulosiphila megalodicopiae TaxID=2724896 RepID=UPI003BAE7334